MPPDNDPLAKANQIAHRFFIKFVLVTYDARNVASEPRDDAKTDKWFNIEIPDSDVYKEQLRLYKSISQLGASPPPFELQVLMTVPELTDSQVLVQHPPNSSRIRVEPTPTHILLESWTLTFVGTSSGSFSSQSSSGEVTLATVYKHIMSLIRSLYTLLRVLPVWKICKRLRRRPGASARNGQLGLMLHLRPRNADGSASEDMRYLGFDEPLSPSSPPLKTVNHTFEPVTHPLGVFSAAVTYLEAPHFEIDTVEALLSSRFLSLDAGPEFTPTLARTSQRESIMSASPGSLPARTSLPLSPTSDRTDRDRTGVGLAVGAGTVSSIADRFVFPANNTASGSRTSFPSTSPRSRNTALPSAPGPVQRSVSAQQPQTGASAGSAGSVDSSSRPSREETREGATLARLRRESTGMGRGPDLPSTPGPLLIRRPSATVNAFKSGTLSSGSPSLYSNSPSLRHGSPLSGPSLPAAPTGRTPSAVQPSPKSTRLPVFRGETGVGPSSPIATAHHTGSSPVLSLRPSPPTPFAPSSLGERRFPPSSTGPSPSAELGITGSDPVTAPLRRKRYSSSFGYRYAAAGSDGSAGSGEKGKEPERVGSASYLSTNTDDDDISAFVQDIDARKPIGGGFNSRHDRERTLSEAGLARRALLSGAELPERPQLSQRAEVGDAERSDFSRRRTRTVSEGPRGSALAREVATSVTTDTERQPSEQSGSPLSQGTIEERLRSLNNAFRESMGLVERRLGVSRDSARSGSDTPPSSSAPFSQARPLPVPGASHLRTPSFGASGAVTPERPLSAPRQARRASGPESSMPPRRFATTPGGGGQNVSVWDNRRLRSDSDGSSTSAVSEIDRARLYYERGHAARGSGGSVSAVSGESEEAVGRMDLDRNDQ